MIHLTSVDLKKVKAETLVIPVCQDKQIHDDATIATLVRIAKRLKEFKGEKGDQISLYNLPDVKTLRVVFMGLGKLEKVDMEALRATAGKAVMEAIKKDLSNMLIAVPAAAALNMEIQGVLESMMEGACLGNHLFDKYKKEKKHKPLKKIHLLVSADAIKNYRKLSDRIETVCQGTILAREWVSTPPNDKKPEQFSNSIAQLARKENLKVTVWGEKELKQKNFGAILAVAAGSRNRPRMVILEHHPKKTANTIVLVGKGVTFDSGGINLKPSGSLEDMKLDMSGAAAVAATLISLARLKSKASVVGIIPVVENMPSGDASRPGDIINSFAGKTVEIGNTDAEGRLILIDAIAYGVKRYKPRILIDLATLTGACVVALGEKIAGLFSFDDKLAEDIFLSGAKTHERCWRMPLPEDYKELLKSDFADLNNMSSTRYGGAITAALFLSEFIGETRWAHIDIAGPAYTKKETAYCGAGGTGFGVRLLCDLLEKL
ncbi:MAG: leucyl aminopeptidase [Pseudomonadota bacterium]|uniref:Probable cytosol aminopeptidase n=1 Tax=Candidatus Desulfatibia profunda TaxID=2841695 RepID=A0A8J6NTJ2_9BACT|nr:leucyl aminopeptidase [Candidatus Desulfatibia profunda]MBL7179444.1 leucyl aminopeptidase [Desulfobacterales bacterium]MBU0699008.1 leucyl aminopeptidase [Pseudomonadota bacterium]